MKTQIKYYEENDFVLLLEMLSTQLRMNRSELIRLLVRLGLKKLMELRPDVTLPASAIDEIMSAVNNI